MNTAINNFKNAMLDVGITPPETVIPDGHLHRSKDSCGKLTVWYVLHLDGRAAGSFGDWKQGIKERWKQEGQHELLTDAERLVFKAQCIKQDAERKAEEAAKHAKAAITAMAIWCKSPPAIYHPYLIKKRIKPYQSRIYKDCLVIPVFSSTGELVNLQFIQGDGRKRFLSGGKKSGCFCSIGEDTGQKYRIVLIVEGYATGATLHEILGHFTIVAFDAGNLITVAKTIKEMAPEATIIICADNDSSGVGEQKARAAAMAINCKYIIPPMLGDFNDHLARSI
ncbi:MAG: toprim domain-containing protein [Methylococcaceae bacterium]